MTALSDTINAAIDQRFPGISLRALAAKTDGRISKDAITKYRNGTHGKPSPATLRAWADVLTLPLVDLETAAVLPNDLGLYTPPDESARLTRRQRAAVDELIRAMSTNASQEPVAPAAPARDLSIGDVVRYQHGTALYVVTGRHGDAVDLLDMQTGAPWGKDLTARLMVLVASYDELWARR